MNAFLYPVSAPDIGRAAAGRFCSHRVVRRRQLDDDHYGLAKVKRRIIEYLAVRRIKNDMKGPILCFVGPPGVGKTSVGRSIAKTMSRQFHR